MGDLPRSVATSTMTIVGVELIVHVLDNGQRVFEAPGFEELLRVVLHGDRPLTEDEAAEVARVIKGIG